MSPEWAKLLRFCIRMTVATACAVVISLAFASNPSEDDVASGAASYGTGAAGGAVAMKILDKLFDSKGDSE